MRSDGLNDDARETERPRARGATVAGVPVLIATPSPRTAAQIPTVLWYHGFRADALAHAAELEQCAAMGFLAVGVDAVGHGARRDDSLSEQVARSATGALPAALALVDETIDELPALLRALSLDHRADADNVSLVGISMGAFLVYRAIARFGGLAAAPFTIRRAVALLGAPLFREMRGDTEFEAFRHVALLSITAEHDVSVPPSATVALHRDLEERFATPSLHRHHELRGAGHLTSAPEWAEAMSETMNWLEPALPTSPSQS